MNLTVLRPVRGVCASKALRPYAEALRSRQAVVHEEGHRLLVRSACGVAATVGVVETSAWNGQKLHFLVRQTHPLPKEWVVPVETFAKLLTKDPLALPGLLPYGRESL